MSVCLGGLTLATTWTGRPEGRVATVGIPKVPVVAWVIGRMFSVSSERPVYRFSRSSASELMQ